MAGLNIRHHNGPQISHVLEPVDEIEQQTHIHAPCGEHVVCPAIRHVKHHEVDAEHEALSCPH